MHFSGIQLFQLFQKHSVDFEKVKIQKSVIAITLLYKISYDFLWNSNFFPLLFFGISYDLKTNKKIKEFLLWDPADLPDWLICSWLTEPGWMNVCSTYLPTYYKLSAITKGNAFLHPMQLSHLFTKASQHIFQLFFCTADIHRFIWYLVMW